MMIFTGDNHKIGRALIALLVSLATAGQAWGAEPSAYKEASAQTLAGLDEIRPYLTPPGGVVVSAKDGALFIGKDSDIPTAPGTSLKIVREKEPLVHPVTGEKVGAVTEPVGEAIVTGDEGKILTAIETGDAGKIRIGDIVEKATVKRKAILIFTPGADSPGMASIRSAVVGRVSSFGEVGLVSPSAVERFLNDNNLAGTNALTASPENLKKLRKGLGADLLIFVGAQEKDGAILIDVALYDLSSGRQAASFKGLAKAVGKTSATTATPKPAGKGLAEPVQTATPSTPTSPVTAKTLGNFEGRITAIAVYDLDGDGAPEIIVGFDQRLAVYKMAPGGPLTLLWEKKLSKRDQVVGVHCGDFDGDGKPGIYVNNIVDGAARSMIVKERDGVLTAMSEKLRLFFYAGADGRLYGQRQSADLGMEDNIVALEWVAGKLVDKPFIQLPKGARLSGIAVDDIDGDGVMDVIGVDKGKNLVYHSSVKGEWVRGDGEYGGSDIAIELPGLGEARIFHEIQPAPVLLKTGGKFKQMFVPHNHPASSFFSSLLIYLKSQLHLLSNESGLGYAKTFSTPAGDGIVYTAAYLGQMDGGFATLTARVETSIFGPGKSELIMFTMGVQ